MYRLNYQYTHDIDWFCQINGKPVHIASNGGHLPHDSYTIEQLVSLQHRIANLPRLYKCKVNEALLTNFLIQTNSYPGLEEQNDNSFPYMLPEDFELSDDIKGLSRMLLVYGWSFIEMAQKGFYSFDRGSNEYGIDFYHLVAWPKEKIEIFPKDIMNDLKAYESCCFPPFHEDFVSNFPLTMRLLW